MTLNKIAEATNGKLILPEGFEAYSDKEIAGAVNDNRKIEKDFLFIPMVGAKVDGHDFIDDVFSKGALATLSEKTLTFEQFCHIMYFGFLATCAELFFCPRRSPVIYSKLYFYYVKGVHKWNRHRRRLLYL